MLASPVTFGLLGQGLVTGGFLPGAGAVIIPIPLDPYSTVTTTDAGKIALNPYATVATSPL